MKEASSKLKNLIQKLLDANAKLKEGMQDLEEEIIPGYTIIHRFKLSPLYGISNKTDSNDNHQNELKLIKYLKSINENLGKYCHIYVDEDKINNTLTVRKKVKQLNSTYNRILKIENSILPELSLWTELKEDELKIFFNSIREECSNVNETLKMISKTTKRWINSEEKIKKERLKIIRKLVKFYNDIQVS